MSKTLTKEDVQEISLAASRVIGDGESRPWNPNMIEDSMAHMFMLLDPETVEALCMMAADAIELQKQNYLLRNERDNARDHLHEATTRPAEGG